MEKVESAPRVWCESYSPAIEAEGTHPHAVRKLFPVQFQGFVSNPKSLDWSSAGLDRRRWGSGSPFLILGCTGQAAWSIGWPYPRAGRATGLPNLGGQYTAHEKLVKRKAPLEAQNVVAKCPKGLDIVVRLQIGASSLFAPTIFISSFPSPATRRSAPYSRRLWPTAQRLFFSPV